MGGGALAVAAACSGWDFGHARAFAVVGGVGDSGEEDCKDEEEE